MVRNYKRKTEDRWTKEDLLEALMSIKEKSIKINEASRQFGISRATLYRQYQKFIQAGGKCDVSQFRTCGGNPILTKVEEDVLEKTILDLRGQGFSVTSSDIKRICFEYCDSNSIPNQFNTDKRMASDDWYYGFLKRHLNVRVSKSEGSHKSSATAGKKRKRKGEKRQGKVRRGGKRIKRELDDDDDNYELAADVSAIFNQHKEENEDNEDSNNSNSNSNNAEGSDENREDAESVGGGDNVDSGDNVENVGLKAVDIDAEDSDEGPPLFIGEEPKVENDDDDEIQMPSLKAEVD